MAPKKVSKEVSKKASKQASKNAPKRVSKKASRTGAAPRRRAAAPVPTLASGRERREGNFQRVIDYVEAEARDTARLRAAGRPGADRAAGTNAASTGTGVRASKTSARATKRGASVSKRAPATKSATKAAATPQHATLTGKFVKVAVSSDMANKPLAGAATTKRAATPSPAAMSSSSGLSSLSTDRTGDGSPAQVLGLDRSLFRDPSP
ncbi:hypothetical protein LTS18_014586 [Coniosporium uncinatum]|uniref:Uncharacterized protein n=1 Tax=Coniosporium uncinatum TaxID=93489 RepID=A0ACC3DYF1_9PEZI|nr:hypothetical protein LTS18_014586 [Coniosporium uncinatum]